jgi:hypothetical protein
MDWLGRNSSLEYEVKGVSSTIQKPNVVGDYFTVTLDQTQGIFVWGVDDLVVLEVIG